VTANAKSIRAERYAEIAAIVRRDRLTMIERWAARAAEEQPNAERVHHEALLDHLPDFLCELAAALENIDPEGFPHRSSAVVHGGQRWEVGWSVAEVVRDYRILRLVVLEHLDQCLGRSMRLREVQAVGLALDEAIEMSVDQYVRDSNAKTQRAQELLREADRRKNEFLATLAHELRNPLAPLRNSLEVIRLAGDDGAAFRQVREVMERQVGQMTRLVEDLIDVSRVAQGKLELRKVRVDLREALEQAVHMNAPLRQVRHHHFAATLPPEPLWVEGDRDRLVQIVVNLLNNAAKFTPEGGHLSLEAAAEGEQVAVRVRDDGIGIPTDELGRVFDLFTQVGGSPEQVGGLGIGLSLVRRLVELHGGTVTANSDGVGKGAEFVVRLPACEGAVGPCEPEGAKDESAPARHILIVEDNQDGRESLVILLELLGHHVDAVEDGRRGVEAALSLRPDVALIDINMPGINGYEVARQIRQALGAGVHLVAMTGSGQPEDRQKANAAGFDAHLLKPVEPARLQKMLAECRR
jgi:signal transduction histidine kinase